MKSEIKYLVNPRIREITHIEDIKEYVEKVYFYREGEFGCGCCYIKDRNFWENNPPTWKVNEGEIKPFLFNTEEEAIAKVKLTLEEMILEYEKIIDNFKKMTK